ncbi:AraC family transcriptional regulator, partial [Vibrio fluvialis]|uniref:AraC family transcriptional regulator n=1 Tax=Vibrio fluvialis TaxID=676 RepID=UPI000ADF9525
EISIAPIKMCANLHKYLIIIHDGSYENSIGHHESIFGIMDISVDDPSITLIGLCQKLHMSFDKHIFSPKLQESPISSASMSKEMLDILRYIELNITKEIREEDIAAYCHYSVSYFSKLFHKVIGISFRDYICNKRIAMAKRLLVDERNAKIAFMPTSVAIMMFLISREFSKRKRVLARAFSARSILNKFCNCV